MLTTILIIVAALIIILAIFISTRPNSFAVKRSITIPAPPATVFPHVNDLHLWQAWSPWAKLDPNAKSTFTGAPSGIGASMSWAGNNKIGEGKMTITDSRPNESIRFNLEFFKPFKATNTAEFTLQSQGSGTLVTWNMSGKNNFMGKLFSLLINCDKMIGGQFDQGLASLSEVSRSPASK